MTAPDLRWPTYPSRGVTLVGAPNPHEHGSLHVKDTEGRVYLDAIAGIGCAVLGHAHPRWVSAIHSQLERLASAANSFYTEPQQTLASRLPELFPIDDAQCFFASTGTEATEAALKLALRATGRGTVVAFDRAFHGRTLGAIALTANPKYRAPYVACIGEDHPDRFAQTKVVRVPFGDLEATRQAFVDHGEDIAAVFVEPIQGEGGVYPATREFLLGLRTLCDEHGALLGVDEIQTGMGRTGRWSAWEAIVGRDGPRPDLLWLAKALGAGFPVAACLARAPLAETMTRGSHGTTFGGNPVACAAALATIAIIESEGLLATAAAQIDILNSIAAENPIAAVSEIRGCGAMIGIGIGDPTEGRASAVGTAMMDRGEQGVLVTTPGGHTVRSLLPYRAGKAELETLWSALGRALS